MLMMASAVILPLLADNRLRLYFYLIYIIFLYYFNYFDRLFSHLGVTIVRINVSS